MIFFSRRWGLLLFYFLESLRILRIDAMHRAPLPLGQTSIVIGGLEHEGSSGGGMVEAYNSMNSGLKDKRKLNDPRRKDDLMDWDRLIVPTQNLAEIQKALKNDEVANHDIFKVVTPSFEAKFEEIKKNSLLWHEVPDIPLNLAKKSLLRMSQMSSWKVFIESENLLESFKVRVPSDFPESSSSSKLRAPSASSNSVISPSRNLALKDALVKALHATDERLGEQRNVHRHLLAKLVYKRLYFNQLIHEAREQMVKQIISGNLGSQEIPDHLVDGTTAELWKSLIKETSPKATTDERDQPAKNIVEPPLTGQSGLTSTSIGELKSLTESDHAEKSSETQQGQTEGFSGQDNSSKKKTGLLHRGGKQKYPRLSEVDEKTVSEDIGYGGYMKYRALLLELDSHLRARESFMDEKTKKELTYATWTLYDELEAGTLGPSSKDRLDLRYALMRFTQNYIDLKKLPQAEGSTLNELVEIQVKKQQRRQEEIAYAFWKLSNPDHLDGLERKLMKKMEDRKIHESIRNAEEGYDQKHENPISETEYEQQERSLFAWAVEKYYDNLDSIKSHMDKRQEKIQEMIGYSSFIPMMLPGDEAPTPPSAEVMHLSIGSLRDIDHQLIKNMKHKEIDRLIKVSVIMPDDRKKPEEKPFKEDNLDFLFGNFRENNKPSSPEGKEKQLYIDLARMPTNERKNQVAKHIREILTKAAERYNLDSETLFLFDIAKTESSFNQNSVAQIEKELKDLSQKASKLQTLMQFKFPRSTINLPSPEPNFNQLVWIKSQFRDEIDKEKRKELTKLIWIDKNEEKEEPAELEDPKEKMSLLKRLYSLSNWFE